MFHAAETSARTLTSRCPQNEGPGNIPEPADEGGQECGTVLRGYFPPGWKQGRAAIVSSGERRKSRTNEPIPDDLEANPAPRSGRGRRPALAGSHGPFIRLRGGLREAAGPPPVLLCSQRRPHGPPAA